MNANCHVRGRGPIALLFGGKPYPGRGHEKHPERCALLSPPHALARKDGVVSTSPVADADPSISGGGRDD